MIFTPSFAAIFFTFRLNNKKYLDQHIPLLGYTSLPPPWELPNGSTEPFFRGAEIPLVDSRL
jgi:hypothetical protein